MKLPAYDIIIVLRDPDDTATEFRVVLEKVPRERILEKSIPLRGSLEMFEEMIHDGGR